MTWQIQHSMWMLRTTRFMSPLHRLQTHGSSGEVTR